MTPKDQQEKDNNDDVVISSTSDDDAVLVLEEKTTTTSLKRATTGTTESSDDTTSEEEEEETSFPTTRLVIPKDSAPYTVCTSTEKFIPLDDVADNTSNKTPTSSSSKTPKGEEQSASTKLKKLNLDLGQTFLTRKNASILLWCIQFLDKLLFKWWESIFFKLWKDYTPLQFKRALTFGGWAIYKRLHRLILGKSTGLHSSQSFEYHALTTLCWGSRFFPISPRRVAFSLSQLHVCSPHSVNYKKNVEFINSDMADTTNKTDVNIPKEQSQHSTVQGLYIHANGKEQDQSKVKPNNVIFWIYGGAYLGGDSVGNSAAAGYISKQTGLDVFLPEFRLAPQAKLVDVLWDIALAYKWLLLKVQNQRQEQGKDNPKIFMWGISSGGASVVRLMQFIIEQEQNSKSIRPNYLPDLKGGMPDGAVLFGPYCDYDYRNFTEEGSWNNYDRVDLIVTEAVKECGLTYLDDFILPDETETEIEEVASPSSDDNSIKTKQNCHKEYSPANRNMEGLPPLCVVVSEHGRF